VPIPHALVLAFQDYIKSRPNFIPSKTCGPLPEENGFRLLKKVQELGW